MLSKSLNSPQIIRAHPITCCLSWNKNKIKKTKIKIKTNKKSNKRENMKTNPNLKKNTHKIKGKKKQTKKRGVYSVLTNHSWSSACPESESNIPLRKLICSFPTDIKQVVSCLRVGICSHLHFSIRIFVCLITVQILLMLPLSLWIHMYISH